MEKLWNATNIAYTTGFILSILNKYTSGSLKTFVLQEKN